MLTPPVLMEPHPLFLQASAVQGALHLVSRCKFMMHLVIILSALQLLALLPSTLLSTSLSAW